MELSPGAGVLLGCIGYVVEGFGVFMQCAAYGMGLKAACDEVRCTAKLNEAGRQPRQSYRDADTRHTVCVLDPSRSYHITRAYAVGVGPCWYELDELMINLEVPQRQVVDDCTWRGRSQHAARSNSSAPNEHTLGLRELLWPCAHPKRPASMSPGEYFENTGTERGRCFLCAISVTAMGMD